MRPDVLVLGGGASGLAAAAALGKRGARVLVIERNARVGKKLLATGNGRCNLSNADMRGDAYGDAAAFVSRLYEVVPDDSVFGFWRSLGLMTTEEDGRIYPRTMQAASALDVLRAACERTGVEFATEREVTRLSPSRHGGWTVTAADGSVFSAPAVIAAMGGSAAPQMGTDGSGARLLSGLGHTVTPLYPALVQLRCDHPALRSLKGVRVRAAVSLTIDSQETAREEGELLFADYGVSGVCVFQLSRYASPALAQRRDVRLSVDLLPELKTGEETAWLDARLSALSDASAQALFTGVLPRLVAQCVVRQAQIPADMPAGALTAHQRRALLSTLRGFPFRVTGTQGFAQAQVTRGGVLLGEIDPRTMASRLFDGLYVVGELLDVDGPCGGYNLHFAVASALAAADDISNRAHRG